eukprot:m.93077 g.93077  ORF g.93077 m.93077 type:complete len:75 (-) comp26601_c1_seq1:17-241(-)
MVQVVIDKVFGLQGWMTLSLVWRVLFACGVEEYKLAACLGVYEVFYVWIISFSLLAGSYLPHFELSTTLKNVTE